MRNWWKYSTQLQTDTTQHNIYSVAWGECTLTPINMHVIIIRWQNSKHEQKFFTSHFLNKFLLYICQKSRNFNERVFTKFCIHSRKFLPPIFTLICKLLWPWTFCNICNSWISSQSQGGCRSMGTGMPTLTAPGLPSASVSQPTVDSVQSTHLIKVFGHIM